MPTKKIIAPFYERLALVLIGFCILGYLVIVAKDLLDPLLFGFLFAVLLLPLANFLEKKLRLPRSASSFVAILLMVGFVGGILYLVGAQISNLASDWPMLKKQVDQSVDGLQEWVQHAFQIDATNK
jgi:putative permease